MRRRKARSPPPPSPSARRERSYQSSDNFHELEGERKAARLACASGQNQPNVTERSRSSFHSETARRDRPGRAARGFRAALSRGRTRARRALRSGGAGGTSRSCSKGHPNRRGNGKPRDAPRGFAARCSQGPCISSHPGCTRRLRPASATDLGRPTSSRSPRSTPEARPTQGSIPIAWKTSGPRGRTLERSHLAMSRSPSRSAAQVPHRLGGAGRGLFSEIQWRRGTLPRETPGASAA